MNEKGDRRVLVALWMNGVFGQDVMNGIHDWMRDRAAPWRIRFADSASLFGASLRWMMECKALDGVITYYADPKAIADLGRAGIPCVAFGEWLGEAASPEGALSPSVPHPGRNARRASRSLSATVDADLPAIAGVLADHLFSRADFRAAGYVESYFDHGWSRHRGDAVMAELSRRGFEPRRFLHYGRPSSLDAGVGPDFAGLADWLRALPKPAAVLCANDATADDTIRLCESLGIAVPRDVAVAGIDDNPVFCRHTSPNLTSARLDGRRAGFLAASALAAMMDGSPPPPPESLRYAAAVSRRASTAATPSIGEIVQRAVDFIDLNACRGIGLADVVRHCRHSRTLVAMRFRQMTGRSIVRAIRERRLDEARRYLRETSMTAEEIAPLCGYESASALHRAFSRETGTTMGRWRATAKK